MFYCKKALILLCVFVILLLSACAASHTEEPNQMIIETEDETVSETIVLKEVHSVNKHALNMENAAPASYGFYYLLPRYGIPNGDNDNGIGSANITYIDYEVGESMYLCSVPGCSHNDENCTSFVKGNGEGVLFTDYHEEHLFCMITGYAYEREPSKEQLGYLMMMDKNGSNRKTIYTLKAKESFSGQDAVFVDSLGNVYLSVTVLDEEMHTHKELRRINCETAKTETLLTLEMDQKMESCYSDNIVIRRAIDRTSEFTAYNVNKGNIIVLYEGKSPIMCVGQSIFFADKNDDQTGTLTVVDIVSQDKMMISGIPCIPTKKVHIADYSQGMVNWYFLDNDDLLHVYTVNLTTKEYVENTLTYKRYVGYDFSHPIGIVAEAGNDQFLVIAKAKNCVLHFVDYKGIPYTTGVADRGMFALINRDDYYSSTASYQFINENVFLDN